MTTNEIIVAIAGIAVIVSLLILAITLLKQIMNERAIEAEPQYKRTPEDDVAQYEILNDPAFKV